MTPQDANPSPSRGEGQGRGCEAQHGKAPRQRLNASQDHQINAVNTPPSPTLPPSRGKGEYARESYTPAAGAQAKRLRRALTASEARLWAELRTLKLHFRRQAPIGRYIADFVCHAAKLIVEVDGGRHHLPENQLHDHLRDTWLASAGYRVLRIRDTRAFEEPAVVAAEIAALVSLPPRGGKGGDGGVSAHLDCDPPEALSASPSGHRE